MWCIDNQRVEIQKAYKKYKGNSHRVAFAVDMFEAGEQHQQDKIDKIKALLDEDVYHIPTLIKELKEIVK